MAGKLGRIRPKEQYQSGKFRVVVLPDGRRKIVPRLSAYYDHMQDVQPPPVTVDYSQKATQAIAQMYGNDQYGDCVIADYFHQVGLWTGNEQGSPVIGTTAEAVSAYQTICGPGDQGCIITDVLDYAKKTGITVGGSIHNNDGYVAVDFTNTNLLKVAIDVFGSVRLGINLPQGWYNAADGGLWDVVSGADATIVGGHDVGACGYNATGVVIMTWGGLRTITWAALAVNTWVEEAYAQLAKDWYSQGNLAPNGIDAASLATDLQDIANGTVPPLPGPTPPPSPPPPSPPPPPGPAPMPTATLTALSPTLLAGQGTSLQWSTTDATSAVLTDGNGNPLSQSLSGLLTVGPFASPGTYSYTLATTGPGGSATANATVTVNPAPQPPPPPPAVGYGGTINRHVRMGRNLDIFAAQDTPAGSTWYVTPPGSTSEQGVTALMISLSQQIANLQASQDAGFANLVSILVGTSPPPAPAKPGVMSFSAVGVPGGNVQVTFTWQPQPAGDTAVVYSLQILRPDGTPFAPAVQVPITQQTYTTPPMPDDTATYTMVLTAISGSNPPLSTPSAPFSFVPHTAPPPPPPVPPAAPVVTGYTVADAPAPQSVPMSFSASPFDSRWNVSALPTGVDWGAIISAIEAVIKQFGPAAKPLIVALINASTLPDPVKQALLMLVNILLPS